MILALAIAAALLGQPDRLEEFNARARAVEEPAWPAIRDAGIEWLPQPVWLGGASGLLREPAAGEGGDGFAMDEREPDSGAIVRWLDAHRDSIDRLIAATERDGLGYVSGFEVDPVLDRALAEAVGREWIPGRVAPDSPLLSVLLPHTGQIRLCAAVVSAEGKLALMRGDERRFLDCVRACLRLGDFLTETPTFITYALAARVHSDACELVLWAVSEHGLSEEACASLMGKIRDRTGDRYTPAIDGEALFFEDLVDRVYADDGDGALTRDGAETIVDLGAAGPLLPDHLRDGSADDFVAWAMSQDAFMTRREELALYGAWRERARAFLAEKPWNREPPTPGQWLLEEIGEARATGRGVPIVAQIMTPSVRTMEAVWINRDATMRATLLVLAARRHHERHGAWPESIEELDLEPDAITDPYSGRALVYQLGEDGPIVYSTGEDGDDDGGRAAVRDSGRPALPRWDTDLPSTGRDGDWLLYPPLED